MEQDKMSSLVWLGIAVFICAGSLRLSLGNFHNPGPGFLSFYAGLLMGILAVVVHLQSRKSSRSGREGKHHQIWTNRQRGWKMVWTVLALLFYALAMNYLGFLLSTFIFLTFLLRVIEPQRWTVALGGSLAASLAFYIIFDLGLQSQLPKGLFKIF